MSKSPKLSAYTENFFGDIVTQEQAYILGFWLGDGTVLNSCNGIRLKISVKDLNLLKKIKSAMQLPLPIVHTEDNRYEGEVGNCVHIYLNSERMKQDMIKHGCVPSKTLILEAPKLIPDDLTRHLIRGYFDADGSIFRKIDRKLNKTYTYYTFDLLGTKEFLEYAVDNLPVGVKIWKRTDANIYRARTSAKAKVKKIKDYLYKDSYIHLERKKTIFDEII